MNAEMEIRVGNYVTLFSTMTGSRLFEIYKKPKELPPTNSIKNGNMKVVAGPNGRDSDSNAHGGSNHMSSSHLNGDGGKKFESLEALSADPAYNYERDRGRGDSEIW